MTSPDEVSFGSWRVTRAESASPVAKDTLVEVRLIGTNLVLLDARSRSLGSWPIGTVSVDYYNDANGVLRLGTQRLEITSVEQRPPPYLRGLEQRALLAKFGSSDGRSMADRVLKFGAVVIAAGVVGFVAWALIAFSNYTSSGGVASSAQASGFFAFVTIIVIGAVIGYAVSLPKP